MMTTNKRARFKNKFIIFKALINTTILLVLTNVSLGTFRTTTQNQKEKKTRKNLVTLDSDC